MSAVAFILGSILVLIISTKCPPKKFKLRLLNFLFAVPGAIAVTSSIVPTGVDLPLITTLVAVLLTFYVYRFGIFKGMSNRTFR